MCSRSNKVKCPCCGFHTLVEEAAFEICSICNWEDDGQGDRNEEIVMERFKSRGITPRKIS